jgi:hypothetical protein
LLPGLFAGIDGTPDVKHGDEGNEAEHRPGQKIKPVGQIILNADADDVPIFSHEPGEMLAD